MGVNEVFDILLGRKIGGGKKVLRKTHRKKKVLRKTIKSKKNV